MTERRTFALLGSGEFEPWAADVDRWLLERASGDGRVLVVPTASAPEGEETFERWAHKGLEHYAALGAPAEVLPLRARADAEDPALAGALRGASLAFFSGGNPSYLAETLAGTAFWSTLLTELDRGMAYAGCSAGMACLGDVAPDGGARSLSRAVWHTGLGLFPGWWLGPHWDALDSFIPGLREFVVGSVPLGARLLAIDENTAVVGDGRAWSVVGSGGAHVLEAGAWRDHASGSSFDAALLPG